MAQAREINTTSKNVLKKPSNFCQQRFPSNNKCQKVNVTKRDLIPFCGKISNIKMGHQEKEKQDIN